MKISSCYPVIMTDRVSETAAFYRTFFGYSTSFETEWYVSLVHRSDSATWELAVLQFDHPTVPAEYRHKTRGVLINVEVEDAAAEYDRLVGGESLTPILELRDEEFGQRHFIVADPAGTMVDVIQNIPPQGDFAAAYPDG